MVTAGINAIVFGAMLLLLGMMPDVVAALREGLQNFRDHFFFKSSTYRNDLPPVPEGQFNTATLGVPDFFAGYSIS